MMCRSGTVGGAGRPLRWSNGIFSFVGGGGGARNGLCTCSHTKPRDRWSRVLQGNSERCHVYAGVKAVLALSLCV